MSSAGESMITIAQRRWGNPRTVRVARVSASWELSRPGRLSAFLPARDAWSLGFGTDLRGHWVHWRHPRCGSWGGVIWDTPSEDGLVEIVAQSFHVLLSGRRSSTRWFIPTSTPGAIAQRLIWQAHTDQPLPFTSFAADETGTLVEFEQRGEDILSLLTRLADDAGAWFDIGVGDDGSLSWEWRTAFRDRTAEVRLTEGHEVGQVRIEPTLQGIVNDLMGVGGQRTLPFRWQPHAFVVDGESVRRHGRWQATVEFPTLRRTATLQVYVSRELARRGRPPLAGSLTMPAGSVWAGEVRQGDRIGLRSWSANRETALRVVARAVDTEAGELTVSGLCEDP